MPPTNSLYYNLLLVIFCSLCLSACSTVPKAPFDPTASGQAPDYSLDESWAALPWVEDNADRCPPGLKDKQANAAADVFFVHPTLYYGKRAWRQWNPTMDNTALNKSTDDIAMLYQASVFNQAAKIYAPRYRQAHYYSYFTADTLSAQQALDLAYEDIKSAFGYYMSHHNKGRPIILAGHSQGATHLSRILEEFFDEKPLQKQLVVAYLWGMPIDLERYKGLKPCASSSDTGCMVGWRTYKTGTKPKVLELEKGHNLLITNPLSWNNTKDYQAMEKHQGRILFDFEKAPQPKSQDAQIYQGILWTNKPKFFGNFVYIDNNYHRGDINLFYLDISHNAAERVSVFTKKQ